jgi:hypothetical protein
VMPPPTPTTTPAKRIPVSDAPLARRVRTEDGGDDHREDVSHVGSSCATASGRSVIYIPLVCERLRRHLPLHSCSDRAGG